MTDITKIEYLCKKIEIEAKKEPLVDFLCDKKFNGTECTRPLGHSGMHISLGFNNKLYLMWHDDLSDINF